ncbi:hypothetical protein FDP41_005775 [Naegleria fowleri]|uniref:Heme O synthase n=1 Tax=Naegleria fowleri TaxID=5763 RepID=A0A6A5BJG3_NAEFO|nr:uncharacterized protein FDP41_005775 [Naegleria fowleri]KAF0975022.1 hypothetical protein FDP41_005775 [Naegleria fowleri]CAG4718963.1 unnamed protein product [Naegleria fowleri]
MPQQQAENNSNRTTLEAFELSTQGLSSVNENCEDTKSLSPETKTSEPLMIVSSDDKSVLDVCPVEESLHEVKKVLSEIPEDDALVVDVNEKLLVEEEQSKKKGLFRHYLRCYYELWKTRLSSLVVFTAGCGYYAANKLHVISEEKDEIIKLVSSSPSRSSVVGFCIGTFLQAASANSFNEILEIERDKLMKRTFNRPLPRNKIGVPHAITQAVVAGAAGTFILYKYTNKETALLGLANLLLYVCVYTPTKPVHWINTWIGTLNGSLPPLMGVTAAMLPYSISKGLSTKSSSSWMSLIPSSDYNNKLLATGLFMFGSMYLWQITHFMAISYKCRRDYDIAGYKMLSISNPEAAATQSLLHSLALFPLCWSLPAFGVVPWWFAVVTTPINYYFLLKPAITFKKNVTYDNATRLFFKSLAHLSILYGLAMVAFKLQQSESYLNLADKASNFFSRSWESVKSLF